MLRRRVPLIAVAPRLITGGAQTLGVSSSGNISPRVSVAGTQTLSVSSSGNISPRVSLSGAQTLGVSSSGNILSGPILSGTQTLGVSSSGNISPRVSLSGAQTLGVSSFGNIFTPLAVVVLHRAAAPLSVQRELMHRSRVGSTLQRELAHRVSNDRAQLLVAPRVGTGQRVRRELVHRILAAGGDIVVPASQAPWGTPVAGQPGMVAVSEYELAWRRGIGALVPNLRVLTPTGSVSLGEIPALLQVTHNESAALQWSLTLLDSTGQYHPRCQGGDWEGLLDNRAYAPDGSIAKKLVAEISWGGYPYRLVGIPTGYGHSRSFMSGTQFDFQWRGVCVSEKLFKGGKTAPTLRTVRNGTVVTNVGALKDIAARAGIQIDVSQLRQELVRVQHRQDGREADWFQQLCDMTLAEWQTEGEVIRVYQPVFGGAPQWRYNADALLLEDSLDAPAVSVVNKITARRANEGGKSNGEATEVNAYGKYTVQFSRTLNNVQWEFPPSALGAFSDFIFRNESGTIIAVREVRDPRVTPWPLNLVAAQPVNGARSVEFTWGAPQGVLAAGYPGSIEFRGSDSDQADDESYDPVYNVTRRAPASIADYGEQAAEMQPNPLIYDSAALERWAKDYLIRNATDKLPQTFRAPLNPAMRPGQLVEIVDPSLNLTEVRRVRQCTHSFSDFPEQRFTRFTCELYEPELEITP